MDIVSLINRLCVEEYFPGSELVPKVQFHAFHEVIIWNIFVNLDSRVGAKSTFPSRCQILCDSLLYIQDVHNIVISRIIQ